VYNTISFSPLFADDGKIGGLINISTETTSTVLMTRQLKTITDLTNRTQGNYLDKRTLLWMCY